MSPGRKDQISLPQAKHTSRGNPRNATDDDQLQQLMEAKVQEAYGTFETGGDLGEDSLPFHTKVDVNISKVLGWVYLVKSASSYCIHVERCGKAGGSRACSGRTTTERW